MKPLSQQIGNATPIEEKIDLDPPMPLSPAALEIWNNSREDARRRLLSLVRKDRAKAYALP